MLQTCPYGYLESTGLDYFSGKNNCSRKNSLNDIKGCESLSRRLALGQSSVMIISLLVNILPRYMICTLILSEHNKGKLNYSIFPRGVYMFVGDILRFVPWEERSSIGEVFFSKWI